METTSTTAAWFLPFVTPIALYVAWSDLAHMKITNKAVLALLVVFAAVGLIALPFTDYLWRYSHFAVVLAVGFVLNALRLMGGGDAKFGAAMAPFIALGDWFIFWWVLAGTTMAAYIVHRIVMNSSIKNMVPDWESWQSKKFPLGFALGPTLIIYLMLPFILPAGG